MWNGKRLPSTAQKLVLPNGRELEDAIIWPNFCQTELGLEPRRIWDELLEFPTFPDDQQIPFRARGDQPHWITGRHRALHYRGNELKREKIWCQSGYEEGLRRYGYTGWQYRIGFATHNVEHVKPIKLFADRLNAGLTRSGHQPHNHWIVTRYNDQDHSIGFHADKDKDFAPDSYFIVVKLGAPREFAFRLPKAKEPFYCQPLEAGTAVFVRCRAKGAANDIVQHGVPISDVKVGVSGSIVSRCITTTIPWDKLQHEIAKRVA